MCCQASARLRRGYEYVAVTPDGDIYPCHQFVGKDEFKQGSVLDQSFNMDIAQKFAGMNIYLVRSARSAGRSSTARVAARQQTTT